VVFGGLTYRNVSSTVGSFTLTGGKFGISVAATWSGGAVTLQLLAADLEVWLDAMPPFTTNAVRVADLPPGRYQLAVSGAVRDTTSAFSQ
jgi:hypothetical protein